MIIAAASSAPLIDWSSLGKVAAAAFVFGLAIVVVYSVGILGLSLAAPSETGPGAGRRPVGVALAAGCFALCLAAVGYGLWIIIPQFHR